MAAEYSPEKPPESTPLSQWTFRELLRLQQIIIELQQEIEELKNGS